MYRVLLALVFAAYGAFAPAACAENVSGQVFAVLDGDTLLVKTDAQASARQRAFTRVRLADIDAPEADQPHGELARRALTALVLDRRVMLDTVTIDRYGRSVARVFIDGQDLSAILVRDGHVWASRLHTDAGLIAMEKSARTARRGLWADAGAIPPWRWRKR